jgi:hypothetical protein
LRGRAYSKDNASFATPFPRYSFSVHKIATREQRGKERERVGVPAIIISHSTSSSTPFGKNRFTSPIILKDLISWDVGVVVEVEGRSRRMNVSSEWVFSQLKSRKGARDLLSSSVCHFSETINKVSLHIPTAQTRKHTLHLEFLIKR